MLFGNSHLIPVPTPGITVDPIDGLTTNETGGQVSFTVVPNSPPSSDVTIGISSDDTTEGTVDTTELVFTSANWNVPQTVTITGEDDSETDGDMAYAIITTTASSSDPAYSNMMVLDVAVVNLDDEVTGTALYVYEIRFEQHPVQTGTYKAISEIYADNGDNVAGNDSGAVGVAITVNFAGKEFSGTTDSNGIFTTSWVRNLPSGTSYYANVLDLVMADYYWQSLLDQEDDSDGDGKPDEVLAL